MMRCGMFVIVLGLTFALTACKGEGKKVEGEKLATKTAAPATAQEGTISKQPAEAEKAPAEKTSKEQPAQERVETTTKEPSPPPAETGEQEEEQELTSTVVARVNGVDIDAKDYVERLKKLTKGKVTQSMVKKTVVDRMINDELLRQEIARNNITVTDEEIAEAMNMDMDRFTKQKEAMQPRVKAFSERVALRKLLQAKGLLAEPTEEELKAEFERRFGLKLDVVTVPLGANPTEEVTAKARETANQVLESVRAGTTLREAVKDKTDPEGRKLVVKPMFIKKGDERHVELWKAAETLNEKDLGGPVTTPQGVVVFQLAKRIEPRQTFEEMKDKLVKSTLNIKTAQAKHKLLEQLREESKIEYLIEFKEPQMPRLKTLAPGRLSPRLSPAAPEMLKVAPPAVGAPSPAETPRAAETPSESKGPARAEPPSGIEALPRVETPAGAEAPAPAAEEKTAPTP